MSIHRRQLFLDRFLAYNRLRYRDNPEALKRLNLLTFEDLVFDGIAVDNSKPGENRRRVANIHADPQKIEGIDQRWTCTSLIHTKVIPETSYVNPTPFETLDDFLKINSQGLYQYYDAEGILTLGVVIATDSLTTANVIPEVIALLNESAEYQLLSSEVAIEDENRDKYPMYCTYTGDTIYGNLTILRQHADRPTKGDEYLGYYGEFPSNYLISSGTLLDMFGLSSYLIPGKDFVPWLKFAHYGKVIYIAKQPIGKGISYNQLAGLGLVNGDHAITLDGKNYRLRLLETEDGVNSEWERLMYRVHYQDPTGTFWETFGDDELGLGTDPMANWNRDGSFSITRDMVDAANAVTRGGGPDGSSLVTKGQIGVATQSQYYGYRPVLEYIGISGTNDYYVAEVTPPVPLDWSPVINSHFDGVLRPYDFIAKLIPDLKISILKVENSSVLQPIVYTGFELLGPSIPQITEVINTSAKPLLSIHVDKVIPRDSEIFAIGKLDTRTWKKFYLKSHAQ